MQRRSVYVKAIIQVFIEEDEIEDYINEEATPDEDHSEDAVFLRLVDRQIDQRIDRDGMKLRDYEIIPDTTK